MFKYFVLVVGLLYQQIIGGDIQMYNFMWAYVHEILRKLQRNKIRKFYDIFTIY